MFIRMSELLFSTMKVDGDHRLLSSIDKNSIIKVVSMMHAV